MEKTRILIVEDESLIALEIEQNLLELGYCVVSIVNSGNKAIATAESEKPDLILMNIRLKDEMDGIKTANEIQSRFEIPIVFLTAFADEEKLEKARLAMPFGYLLKPVKKRELKVSIEMALYASEIDRKRRQAEDKYRIAFKTSPDAVNINRLDGLYVDINDGFTQLTGFTRDDVIGKLSSEIEIWAIPQDREKLVRGLRENGSVENLESKFKAKDGSLRTALMSASLITINNEPHILSVTRDITERKRAEEELRKQKDLLELITQTSPVGISVVNNDGQITFANRTAESILGLVKENITQRTYNDPKWKIVDVDGGPFSDEDLPFRRVTATGKQVFDIKHGIEWADGKRVILSINAAPLLDKDGNVTGMVSSMNDITESRQAENQIHKLLEEKETLLKEVHHRIKNNMVMIQSLLSLQASNTPNKESAATLENAKARLQSMMVLYDKLYRSNDFKKMSVREYLPDLIDEIVGNFPHRCPITVEKKIDDFVMDVNSLSTIGIILNELITNSLKYAFSGNEVGALSISINRYNGHVIMIVKDDGKGLPDTFNFDNSQGFGLKLVSLLTGQLNGTLKIEQDQGTRFIIHMEAQTYE